MKHLHAVLVAVIVVALSLPALAKNTVKVQGDLQQDGFLTINLDWKVDTKKYKGVPESEIRKRVKEDMYKEVLPKLVEKTEGMAVSFDKSNFQKLSENIKLVESRNDGSEVYDVDMKVRFSAPCRVASQSEPAVSAKKTREYEPLLLRSWDNTY